jgi:hypothetical protein
MPPEITHQMHIQGKVSPNAMVQLFTLLTLALRWFFAFFLRAGMPTLVSFLEMDGIAASLFFMTLAVMLGLIMLFCSG